MNKEAYDAVTKAWALTIKARALCPFIDESAIGRTGYISPDWYREHGAVYFVNLAQPLTGGDVQELIQIGSFINRSFVISMAAVLEVNKIAVLDKNDPNYSKEGGKHALLTKWLRNRFAHGQCEYNADKTYHVETRELLAELFPEGSAKGSGFVTSIDDILEPLKDRVLAYISAAT